MAWSLKDNKIDFEKLLSYNFQYISVILQNVAIGVPFKANAPW